MPSKCMIGGIDSFRDISYFFLQWLLSYTHQQAIYTHNIPYSSCFHVEGICICAIRSTLWALLEGGQTVLPRGVKWRYKFQDVHTLTEVIIIFYVGLHRYRQIMVNSDWGTSQNVYYIYVSLEMWSVSSTFVLHTERARVCRKAHYTDWEIFGKCDSGHMDTLLTVPPAVNQFIINVDLPVLT